MHAWEQIQKTVNYIEEHLGEEISVDSLAELAALSPFYYQRLFRRLVKKPVAEYVKLRRLAKAMEELQSGNQRILDVALKLGFSSHEHFSRTFKQTFGMTPDEFRRNPQALNRMTKPELLLNYVLVDEGVPLIADGIVLEINRRKLEEPVGFVGMKMDMPISFINGLGTESGVDPLNTLWTTFHQQKSGLLGLTEEEEEIGVTLPSAKEGCFSYFAGGRAGDGESLCPDGYRNWELPAGDYLVCSFEAENFAALVMDVLYKAEQYLFQIWLPKHQLQSEPFCAERYANQLPEISAMEVWLKLTE